MDTIDKNLNISGYIWSIFTDLDFWKSTCNQVSEAPISLIPKGFRSWKNNQIKSVSLI